MDQPSQASAMPQDGAVAVDATAPTGVRLNGNANSNGATTGAVPAPANGISADEIALYDRQIRLWGIQAQEKIRSANVLLITMKGLANEIAKNLVLAGIGSLTVVDHEVVTEVDQGAQFLLASPESPIGKNRAEAASEQIRKLNPRVAVHVDQSDIRHKGPSYFAAYDIVIATDLDPDTLNIINTATRLMSKPLYATGTHGLYGFIFNDLIEHDYVIQRDMGNVPTEIKPETRTRSVIGFQTKKENGKTIEMVTKRELYSTWFLASDAAALPEEFTKSPRRLKAVTPALSCLRALWDFVQVFGHVPGHNREDLQQFTRLATAKHGALGLPSNTLRSEFLRSFLQNLGSEIAPVTAILGAQLAQDVINVLGHTQQPIQNMVIFDGNTMESTMYPLHPEGLLGAQLLSANAGLGVPMPNGVDMGAMGAMPDLSAMGAMPDMANMAGLPDMTGMAGMSGMPDMTGMGAAGPGGVMTDEMLQQAAMYAPVDMNNMPPTDGTS
ncbi:uncharacterized protein E0L32_005499 [Thyridium curvatum]|uniref:Ubiquitin-like 1-activating enzyme E1A n=1 Tax=Thyridium curvatum TaxID=1093900 RepID=A0A507B366_9PEZI|nr:uncharacterized protein E0L32_005499 [Thyridium curvatum]TPX14303.1 hypothetical protein E0L32_005499 [Thyridium curvatum]